MIGIDMDMPEKCGLCPLFHAEHPMYCQGVKADRKKKTVAPYGQPRPDWCPLHPLDDEIRVGDEVCFDDGESFRAVVLDAVSVNGLWCVLTENGCISIFDEKNFHRTGRHFDEIEALLKQMRGEQDDSV